MSAEAEASTGHWADPGLFTVAPGVHRVPLPLPTDGLRAVNVYVVEEGDGLVLIDSAIGCPPVASKMVLARSSSSRPRCRT